jgi:L-seryl-tRNA(Ser) seleniumtransferase
MSSETRFDKSTYLRRLSGIDQVLELNEIQHLMDLYPRELVVDAARQVIDHLREDILATENEAELARIDLSRESVIPQVRKLVEEVVFPSLRRVINATGVVIHTNLGRSILSRAAVEGLLEVASHYSNLEFDLKKGERGSRHAHLTELIKNLTGAEDGMVVNNNASAVLLALSAFARGKEVVVSRGELVEIGGSFRIPDVMRESGATLKEVGTTNKTYVSDYRAAIGENTAMLLKVHTSNFKIMGFTHEASMEELVHLGKEFSLPVMYDLGSGVLVSLPSGQLGDEPTVASTLKAGADIITFSGDKLLGGPQAGIIVGKARYIQRLKKYPLARAIRVDKFTIAALEATLKAYFDPTKALEEIPTLRMISMSLAELRERAHKLATMLSERVGERFETKVEDEVSRAGGGALPLAELPTAVVSVAPRNGYVVDIEKKLRASDPPVIVRIKDEKILLDVRTILLEEYEEVVEAFIS